MKEQQREYVMAELDIESVDDNTISKFDILLESKKYPDLNYCIDCIKNTNIKQQLFIAFDEVPNYFYKVAASSTGKYHPTYALGEGGLLRHTIAATKIACDIVNLEMFELTSDEKDYIICALLLHDTFKHGVTQGLYTCHNHPLLSSQHIRVRESQ